MEQVIFHCRACGLALTEPLVPLPSLDLLSEADGTDHLPPGFYLVAPSPEEEGGYYTESVGNFLINLRDARNTAHHADRRRLNGCCGLDGCDGRNTICRNGHEIGTERSDCWHAHSLSLDPGAVTAIAVGAIEADCEG